MDSMDEEAGNGRKSAAESEHKHNQ